MIPLIIFGAWVVLIVVLMIQRQEYFEKHFPPISDEEFVSLCTPGTRPEVALKVRRIISEHLAVEYERIHPSMSFVEDIGAD